MDSMVSLRLSEAQAQGVNEAAQRSGLSRSEWLRQLIERELKAQTPRVDPHQEYLRIMAKYPPLPPGTPPTHGARDHSKLIKEKLRAAHRR
jgi:hypothetical protein